MKMEIKCLACASTLGEIDKEKITDADVAEYRQMVSCECASTQLELELLVIGEPPIENEG